MDSPIITDLSPFITQLSQLSSSMVSLTPPLFPILDLSNPPCRAIIKAKESNGWPSHFMVIFLNSILLMLKNYLLK